LTSDPDAALGETEQLLASDAALTARVLQIAASPLYGSKPAKNLHAAIVRLGLKEVRNLALTMAVGAKSADAFQRNLWQYTLASAVFAEVLAKRLGPNQFREPFVCGLLHDLGTLVMAKVDDSNYHMVARSIGADEQAQREQAVYGFTHCDIGAMAAERWQLFEGVEEVIQFHHEPFGAELLAFPEPVLATIYLVALAARMAHCPDEALGSETGRELLERLGTSEEVVREEFEKARSKMDEFIATLG
jgi:HD-like signal output (HDOD) protein